MILQPKITPYGERTVLEATVPFTFDDVFIPLADAGNCGTIFIRSVGGEAGAAIVGNPLLGLDSAVRVPLAAQDDPANAGILLADTAYAIPYTTPIGGLIIALGAGATEVYIEVIS